jgi:hypothetical protein
MKVMTSSIVIQKHDTEAFQVVVLFLVKMFLRVFFATMVWDADRSVGVPLR